jgi:hypothetical protein
VISDGHDLTIMPVIKKLFGGGINLKKHLILLTSILLGLGVVFVNVANASSEAIFEAYGSHSKIMWNNEAFEPDSPVVVIDGRTYIPLREFSNQAGLTVDWNGDEETIAIDKFEFYESHEGSLSNGFIYNFFGKDKYNLSLDAMIDENKLVHLPEYDSRAESAKTPQEAVEISLNHFDVSDPNSYVTDIFYDYKTDNWVIELKARPMEIFNEVIDGESVIRIEGGNTIIEGVRILTLNRSDGTVAMYSNWL